MSRRYLVPFLATLALGGCQQLLAQMSTGGGGAGKAANSFVYRGSGCPDDRRMVLQKGESNDERAYKLLCTEWPGFGYAADVSLDLEARHAQLDDRHFDPLTVATMVETCARFCNESQRIEIGMTAGLATYLDPVAVRAAIDHLSWSADAKTFFVQRTVDAAKALVAVADTLDERRKALYVALPAAIRADRASYYKAHARDYAALDAATAQVRTAIDRRAVDHALVDKLVDLRAKYFAACSSPDCRFDPFVVDVTKQIVLASLASNDKLTSALEGGLFREDSALRNAYAPSLYAAQYLAMKDEENKWEEYDHAKRGNNDDASLAARFGATPPIHITADSAWPAEADAPGLLRGDPSSFDTVVGIVAAVRPKGDLTEIAFEDTVTSYELTDCVETNRVDAIGSDGHIIYRQNCRSIGTKTERHSTPPVRVPTRDAKNIRPKEEVTALVDKSRSGGVLVVRSAKAQIVQFRQHRLRPDAKYAVISQAASIDRQKKG